MSALDELAALLRKECPLAQLLSAISKTDGDPIMTIARNEIGPRTQRVDEIVAFGERF